MRRFCSDASLNFVSRNSDTGSKADVDNDMAVYVTRSGSKYHRESCRWGNIEMSLSEARER